MQSDLFIGRQLNGFTIQERIGRGGMATVYRAFQPSVNRSVALKVILLDPNQGEKDEFRQRFAQEAKVVAALEHLHILPIYDYGIYDGEIAFLAMRLLRGGSLSDLLNGDPVDLERGAEIFTQMARGLAYAHSKGVVHRDLKPSNILLDDMGNAYLTDFGLAKLIEDSVELTRTGHIVGTPVYMSPEQLRGEALDHRADIYSLGVILYHMLAGKPPFDASDSNMVSVIYQHLEKEPVPPSELNPDIPEEVERVALKALKKNADERYSTADEMANDLNIALGRKLNTTSYPVAASTGSTLKRRTQSARKRRSRRILLLIAFVIVLALAGIGGLFVANQRANTTTAQATIIANLRGRAGDALPSQAEINQAKQRLGDHTFIAYLACNQTSEYHATQAREMGDFARQYGLSYRIYDSDNDRYSQITLIERARSEGAGALIVCPLDITLLDSALRSVEAAHVPLVFLTSNADTYGGVLVGGDDYLMGVEAGRAAGGVVREEMGNRARVIILDYPSISVLVARANGLQDGIQEVARDVEIVGRYLGATRENGYTSVSQLIREGVDFDVILSINDAGSYGAIQAMEEAGFAPDSVVVSSVDAEGLAREYIGSGYFMRASVAIDREQFSRVAIDATVKLLAGATLPQVFMIPPGQVITREVLASESN